MWQQQNSEHSPNVKHVIQYKIITPHSVSTSSDIEHHNKVAGTVELNVIFQSLFAFKHNIEIYRKHVRQTQIEMTVLEFLTKSDKH